MILPGWCETQDVVSLKIKQIEYFGQPKYSLTSLNTEGLKSQNASDTLAGHY